MFGKSKKRSAYSTTVISEGTEIIGDLKFLGHLEIEGTVRGNISTGDKDDGFVRILGKGRVEGEINAPAVVINGTIVGDVYSSKHLELAENAEVNGDVHYAVIEMAKGSHVNGSLVYEDGASKKRLDSTKVASIADVKVEVNS